MTSTSKLTTLSPVPVREIWPSEPTDFTPWLLANSEILGAAIGLDDLELEAAEHSVGSFCLDLIGRTSRPNEVVIVENQFGSTDHGHLGQIMTYAGGTGPQYVVWIAERFRDEHRAALDWLNERTDADTRFFGIEIKIVTLVGAEHLAAPLFEVVAQPNEWGKVVRQSTAVSANADLYAQFWSDLLARLRPLGWTTGTSSRSSFITMSAKSPNVTYCLQFVRGGALSEIRFEHSDGAVNSNRFEAMFSRKAEMEEAYGGSLVFDPLVGYKACKVFSELPGAKVADSDRWPEVMEWMMDSQTRLRRAVEAAGGVPPPPALPSATG